MKNVLLLLFLFTANLSAQNYNSNLNTITTAVPFLLISPDARAGGMGDGGIALSEDGNATHWNISNLAFAKKRFGISASYTPWLRSLVPDINLFYGSVYFKPDSVSAIVGSFRYFSLGSITYTNMTGTVIGQYQPREYAADIGYTRSFFRQLSVGLSFRYVHSDIADTSFAPAYMPGVAYAGNLGMSWHSKNIPMKNMQVQLISGLALSNVGTKVSYDTNSLVYDTIHKDFIPINLGVAQGVHFRAGEKHRISFQVELNKLLVPTPPVYQVDSTTGIPVMVNGQYVIAAGKDPNRSVWKGMTGSFHDAPGGPTEELREVNISIGAEYVYKETFKVRSGYFYEHELKGNRKYLTLGAGISFKIFSLDFSYLIPMNGHRSALKDTLRFTLLFSFDKFKIEPHPHGEK